MTRMTPLSTGWAAGMPYGAGLMEMAFSQNKTYHPSDASQWGYSLGHGGLTYGFSSNQGYIKPAGAGFSVVTNVDTSYFSSMLACNMMQIAAEVLAGEDAFLNCTTAFEVDAPSPEKWPLGESKLPARRPHVHQSFFV